MLEKVPKLFICCKTYNGFVVDLTDYPGKDYADYPDKDFYKKRKSIK